MAMQHWDHKFLTKMEMFSMKKTIVLIAVLVLVVGTAFAAPTFSGNFGFDYKFSLDGDIATSGYDGTAGAADISLSRWRCCVERQGLVCDSNREGK